MEESEHDSQMQLAFEVLDGLSVGDALGEALSYQCYRVRELHDFSAHPDGSIRFTDDTEMAIGVLQVLNSTRSIDEDVLAYRFGKRFREDPERGYGKMARMILGQIGSGEDWRVASERAFSGGGSFGNGAGMRVAPLGAYFSDRLDLVVEMAQRSARVTHSHPEGGAGAVAVAVATATAVSVLGQPVGDAVESVWSAVLEHTPQSVVLERLVEAKSMSGAKPAEVASSLGNGVLVSAQDTVPFCVWNACRCLDDYTEAFLSTLEVDGDCDTNAAIVGGIVTGFAGRQSIPADWLRVRESLGRI